MTQYFDPEELLADGRSKQRRAEAIAQRAHAKLGSRSSAPHFTDGLTAEEIERDTASIWKILGIWRRIGKTSPSPITLPSGRTIYPKKSPSGETSRREYAVTRPRRHGGGLS
jgi:hypothetical protein